MFRFKTLAFTFVLTGLLASLPAFAMKGVGNVLPDDGTPKVTVQAKKAPQPGQQETRSDKNPPAHVLMPVFNARESVLTSIQSVLDQTYPNTKLLVWNDGSTDGTVQMLEQFVEDNPLLKTKVHVKLTLGNNGVAYARSRLIQWSKAKNPNAYILWLDADDKYTDSTFIQAVMKRMLSTQSDICLFNFSVAYEDEGQKANAAGLLKDKDNFVNIMREVLSTPTQSIAPLKLENVLAITSLGWVKCYAPTVKLPETADCPFEDFVYMAALLEASRITALPVECEPIQYLRRSTSICGQRKPENFTHHIPRQLRKFFDTVFEQSKDTPEHLQKLKLAQGFVEAKFNQYSLTLENIITAKTYPTINQAVLELFLKEGAETKSHIQRRIESEFEEKK